MKFLPNFLGIPIPPLQCYVQLGWPSSTHSNISITFKIVAKIIQKIQDLWLRSCMKTVHIADVYFVICSSTYLRPKQG